MTSLAAAQAAAATSDVDTLLMPRVRSNNPAIASAVARATLQSPTFRTLVETINDSDGIVYVEEGECRPGVRACLAGVTAAGSNRLLWVRVDRRDVERHDVDLELMASIGHELQHAVEVLQESSVTNNVRMFMLYSRIGWRGGAGTFETQAAIRAGTAVRDELERAAHTREIE